MPRTTSVLSACALAWPLLLGGTQVAPVAQVPGAFRSISDADLEGTSLAPRGEGFIIESPGEEWVWVVTVDQIVPAPPETKRVYSAFNPRNRELLSVYVIPDPDNKPLSLEFMRGFEAGYRKASDPSRRLGPFNVVATDKPLKDAFRFDYLVNLADGRSFQYRGYAIGSNPKYVFQVMSMRGEDDSVLERWAASFRKRAGE